MVLGGCRWFYVVLGGFRSFHVLVTTFSMACLTGSCSFRQQFERSLKLGVNFSVL